jgi:glycerophosphoryl diester phosphodiesterase
MLIFGHRGSPKRFPENTIPSFEDAVRAGADGFETDLRLLADGVAVLFHDDEIGELQVETVASELVRAEHLHELQRFNGRCTMVLEVKRGGWEDALLDAVGKWKNIIVASFDHALIARLSARKVPFPLGLTFSGVILDLPDYAHRAGASYVFPDHRHVDAALVASLRQKNIRVIPWTANRPRDWQRLADAGCDGVITDYPAEAVEWRAGIR